jgi:hypothetical protein
LPARSLDTFKRETEIVLFGSYGPIEAFKRLEALKQCLIQHGYLNTHLVSDKVEPTRDYGEDENEYNLRKSEWWVEHTSIGLFVFYAGGRNQGQIVELCRLCNNLQHLVPRFKVLVDFTYYPELSTLVKGRITKSNLEQAFFKEEEEACKHALAFLLNQFYES